MIDYEHQTIEKPAGEIRAAGWFKNLEWREGEGLFATDLEWTAAASQMIMGGECRYLSPVFRYSPENGEVLEIVSAGITNTPALDGLQELAALRRKVESARLDEVIESALDEARLLPFQVAAARRICETDIEALTELLQRPPFVNALTGMQTEQIRRERGHMPGDAMATVGDVTHEEARIAALSGRTPKPDFREHDIHSPRRYRRRSCWRLLRSLQDAWPGCRAAPRRTRVRAAQGRGFATLLRRQELLRHQPPGQPVRGNGVERGPHQSGRCHRLGTARHHQSKPFIFQKRKDYLAQVKVSSRGQ